MNKIKGNKYYAAIAGDDSCCVAYRGIENATQGLSEYRPLLVEMTITRVFTRERDLKEIELEIPL